MGVDKITKTHEGNGFPKNIRINQCSSWIEMIHILQLQRTVPIFNLAKLHVNRQGPQ